ncbi:MAG: hypothetical protein JOZ77_00710 [Candidatus Eremiobacteraeota bacterium]|nr:hypothetical protein [Candidatus Eremiobacteraeota bacterium]
MTTSNAESDAPHALELSETLTIETEDGTTLPFEVIGILEDPESELSYAVLRHERSEAEDDDFIVTDLNGNLLEDEQLAQEILDDFIAYAQEEEERSGHNGEIG